VNLLFRRLQGIGEGEGSCCLEARSLRDEDYLKSHFGERCPLPVGGQPRRLSQLIQFSFLTTDPGEVFCDPAIFKDDAALGPAQMFDFRVTVQDAIATR